MTHDPCCPVDNLTATECPLCRAIRCARQQELAKFNESWKVNLPFIEARNYDRGYRDGKAAR